MQRPIGHAARLLHGALALLLGVVVLATIVLGGLAWRLSQGPLDITWAARQLLAYRLPQVSLGHAVLAFEGWRGGLDRPLDIRIDRLSAAGAKGATLTVIPHAEVSLSIRWLLLGRIVPRAIAVDGIGLRAVRDADGHIATSLGSVNLDAPGPDPDGPDPVAMLLHEMSRPAQTDASPERRKNLLWTQLHRVRVEHAQLLLLDRPLGVVWRAPAAMVDLQRGPDGGVTGGAELTLALGGQSVQVSATARLLPGGGSSEVHARFGKVAPAALASVSPALAALSAVDAPVDGTVELGIGGQLDITRVKLGLRMGAGSVAIGQSHIAVVAASATLDADPTGLTLSQARLALAGHAGGPVLSAQGNLHRDASGYAGRLSLDFDQVGFAELGQYWPRGADRGARAWITGNITAGTARAGHVELALGLHEGQGVQVTGVTGQLSGDDLSVSWLRPVPPLEHAQATLSIVSSDELLITTRGGQQAGGALRVTQGSMRITGLSQPDQTGAIDITLAGPLADAWALMHHPRLQLLSKHPVELGEPTGQISTHLTLSLPLDDKVTIDQIPIHAQGQLTNVHLSLAGRSVDQGALDYDVTTDGLKLSGTAQVAAIPTQLGVQMDFRPGPPRQVQTRLSVSGEATIAQLAAAGLDSYGLLSGKAAISATLEERRDGSGQASVHADLQNTGMRLAAAGWQRGAGGAAVGDVRIQLDHDRITGIDRLSLEGDGVSVAGAADLAAGQPSTLRLERIVLGDTRATGSVQFGRPADPTLRVELSGPSLDLSGRFAEHRKARTAKAKSAAGPPWAASLRFDQVLLAGRRRLSAVFVHAEDDGQILRRAEIGGKTAGGEPFSLSVTPEAGGRHVAASAGNGGELLAAADVLDAVQGGRFSLTGRFDDRRADHLLSGTAEFNDFQLRGAPAAAKLLQAMTLYGLVDALRGPGLGVNRMIVPFSYADDVVELSDARAFSPSLGVTVKGQVDLGRDEAELRGTIVPAYFFNTLLGDLPVVGHWFSPEKGGGVFAAAYTVRGSLDDPTVGVNPLAALTPGFLRGVFGIFGKK